MSNSPLATKSILSPTTYGTRPGKICKITPHHAAGKLSATNLANIFTKASRKASANYCIGYDGEIVLGLDESKAACTSSNKSNDKQAITIEVSNDGGASTGWHISDASMNALLELCVDICKRNDIEKLEFTGDKNGSITCHDMFAATTCPGPYLKSKLPWLAEEVNKRLNEDKNPEPSAPSEDKVLTAGAVLELNEVNLYSASDSSRRSKTVTGTYYLWSDEVINGRVKITNQTDRVGVAGQVTGWINESDAIEAIKKPDTTVVEPTPAPVVPDPEPEAPKAPEFDAEKLADEIIKGKWGNGETRKKRLAEAGYTDEQIKLAQSRVDARYSRLSPTGVFAKGDRVKFRTVKSGEKLAWATGPSVPQWVRASKLYIRSTPANGKCTVSTKKTGAVTGVAYIKDLVKV